LEPIAPSNIPGSSGFVHWIERPRFTEQNSFGIPL
jgi:hypothetical protein